MIPVKLTIEGLYSYQKRQTIDFAELTNAGLFGIFGPVGSGKSSILEAITYALYGETERLNNRDHRSYNMMNLKSNKSYIEFDFLNHENRLFRATRAFRRNSKIFEKITPVNETVYYEKIKDQWEPVTGAGITELIGLSYNNFKRTIIIPQGQFKEFLELGAKDRTEMMKEIFQLHRFDLQNNVTVLNKSNQSQLDHLKGKLSGYEAVTEEVLSALDIQLKNQTEEAAFLQKEWDTLNNKQQQKKALKSDFETLIHKQKDLDALMDQKPVIDDLEHNLNTYERLYRAFSQLLKDALKVKNQLVLKQQSAKQQREHLHLRKNEIETLQEKISKIKPEYTALPEKQAKAHDLGLLIQILNYHGDIKKLKTRIQKGSEFVINTQQREQSLQKKIKEGEEKIELLTASRIETKVLMEADNWFTEHRNLELDLNRKKETLENKKRQVNDIINQLKKAQIEPENIEDTFKEQAEKAEKHQKEFEIQKSHLQLQQRLSQFSHNLHEGEACPLCGSVDHPEILKVEDASNHLKTIEEKIQRLQTEQKERQDKYHKARNLLDRKSIFEAQVQEAEAEKSDLEKQIQNHETRFSWKEFNALNPSAFEEKKKANTELEGQMALENKNLTKLRIRLEEERQNEKKYADALEGFKQEEIRKKTQIKQNQSLLQQLHYEEYQKNSAEDLTGQLNLLKEKLSRIETEYKQLNEELNLLSPQLASMAATLKSTEAQLEELETQKAETDRELQSALVEQKINSIEAVQDILAQKTEVQSTRSKIQAFRLHFHSLENSVNELNTKLKEVSFDEALYRQREEKLNLLSHQLKGANERAAQTKGRLEQLRKDLTDKEILLKEKNKLEKRALNLKTLGNLFKGSGFVKFASSVFLRKLCDQANARFHRMTKNQLSLKLNDHNEFEVMDYLNEGRCRSVKTLSGGQSFQASLSLALALAESVQSDARAEKNFFFIDEGFGTQDIDAINIVFETLLNLQKENRIVGIISHVETLKEKIPMALSIEKDEEKGSRIINEWN